MIYEIRDTDGSVFEIRADDEQHALDIWANNWQVVPPVRLKIRRQGARWSAWRMSPDYQEARQRLTDRLRDNPGRRRSFQERTADRVKLAREVRRDFRRRQKEERESKPYHGFSRRLAAGEEIPRDNPSPEPPDLSRGVKKFLEFQDLDPSDIGTFAPSLKIPAEINLAGKATSISYRSKKWRDPADYIHRHKDGVRVGLTFEQGRKVKVPAFIRNAKTLVKLGEMLEVTWEDPNDGEEYSIEGKRPLPELYCIPSGKALIVIEGKRKLLAIIWGGKLDVEDRGIVN